MIKLIMICDGCGKVSNATDHGFNESWKARLEWLIEDSEYEFSVDSRDINMVAKGKHYCSDCSRILQVSRLST